MQNKEGKQLEKCCQALVEGVGEANEYSWHLSKKRKGTKNTTRQLVEAELLLHYKRLQCLNPAPECTFFFCATCSGVPLIDC